MIMRVKAWIAGLVGFGIFMISMRSTFKREGEEELKHEQLKDSVERVERGRKAVQSGRASGSTPDDRVRANDGAWD